MLQICNNLKQLSWLAGHVVSQGTQADGDGCLTVCAFKVAVVCLRRPEGGKSKGKYKGEFLMSQAYVIFTRVHS